ncbi:hypothetical protein A6U97_12130 [Agrobacterium tumefaciens]|uniref:hypothetical protein n=1 Tax=Agrobacterium tumefaciens TaxID=358 RepID=UPI00080F9DD7|nr:hypothetical protein A6U97_12130 [Agrobacterium tumefaciens]
MPVPFKKDLDVVASAWMLRHDRAEPAGHNVADEMINGDLDTVAIADIVIAHDASRFSFTASDESGSFALMSLGELS